MNYIFLALLFFFAGIVPALTGFGVSTVSMAAIPFILPLPIAIPLVAIISTTATGIVAYKTKTSRVLPRIVPLLIGSSIGVTLGMLFLNVISEQLLSFIFGIFLISYALYGFFVQQKSLPVSWGMSSLIGFIAGFLSAFFNIQGPLVGIYTSNHSQLTKTEVKDTIATYMLCTGSFTVVGHYLSERLTSPVIMYALFSLPFMILGLLIGERVAKKINLTWIKRGIYLLVFIAGIALIYSKY